MHGGVKVKITEGQIPEGNQAASDSSDSAANGSDFVVTCLERLVNPAP